MAVTAHGESSRRHPATVAVAISLVNATRSLCGLTKSIDGARPYGRIESGRIAVLSTDVKKGNALDRTDARHPDFPAYVSSGNKARDVHAAMTRRPAFTLDDRNARQFLEQSALSMLRLNQEYCGYTYVQVLRVPDGQHGHGIGTAVMRALCDVADQRGWTLTVSPSTDYGVSSVGRLEKFYKRFGFKSNRGRGRDFETQATMIRVPAVIDR